MPDRRRSSSQRTRGSWLPRLAGIGVVILLAGGGITAYLLTVHPADSRPPPSLPTRVVSYQTVGLVAQAGQHDAARDQLLQLLGSGGVPSFSPIGQTQEVQGPPQWTADLMADGTYIFIYLQTGECLAASGPSGRPALALQHCDLKAHQRWRRTDAAVLSQGHDFYQYASVSAGRCLSQNGDLAGQFVGADLSACSASAPPSQLIAFWWSSL
jgi:hypothetical protein